MTKTQERRTKIFALRMARVVTTPRWTPKVTWLVRECLERFDCNQSWPIFIDWDNSHKHPKDDGTVGFAWSHPRELLRDEVRRFIYDMEDEGHLPRIENFAHTNNRSALADHLTCCIRAASDVGASPSAGVYGYTVGHLRRMWPKRKTLPRWISACYPDHDLNAVPDDAGIWL